MKITVEFDTDNAAFDGDPVPEVHRILDRAKHQIADYLSYWQEGDGEAKTALRDINGNKVGTVKVEETQ